MKADRAIHMRRTHMSSRTRPYVRGPLSPSVPPRADTQSRDTPRTRLTLRLLAGKTLALRNARRPREESGGVSGPKRTEGGQKLASSSSMTSLSRFSMMDRVLVSSGRKFFAKNDATAILPS